MLVAQREANENCEAILGGQNAQSTDCQLIVVLSPEYKSCLKLLTPPSPTVLID